MYVNIFSNFTEQQKGISKQESIPVGSVPSATVSVVCGGVGGWGVPAWGVGVPAWGVDVPAWGCVSQHALRQTPPCEQND